MVSIHFRGLATFGGRGAIFGIYHKPETFDVTFGGSLLSELYGMPGRVLWVYFAREYSMARKKMNLATIEV